MRTCVTVDAVDVGALMRRPIVTCKKKRKILPSFV